MDAGQRGWNWTNSMISKMENVKFIFPIGSGEIDRLCWQVQKKTYTLCLLFSLQIDIYPEGK